MVLDLPYEDQKREVIKELHQNELVKFGEFKLRSGATSPVYFDLRTLVSFPSLLHRVIGFYVHENQENGREFDLVCGVAYTGIPMATVYSMLTGKPMIYRRKEAKDYGTKKMIEGVFKAGQKVLLLDDVITSGGSLFETATELESAGLKVVGTQVLIDRRSRDARNPLLAEKYPINSIFTMDEIIYTLQIIYGVKMPAELRIRPATYGERAKFPGVHPAAARLFDLMEKKQTNLCLSADVETGAQLLELAEKVGPQICLLKTHVDQLDDFSLEMIQRLVEIANRHQFYLFEDRKFADIGKTVQRQLTSGNYQIANWADFVTCHSLPGPGVLQAIQETGAECGVLLLSEMSSEGNLLSMEYSRATRQMAHDYRKIVAGLIGQGERSYLNPNFVYLTPGVNLAKGGDNLGQRYRTPNALIAQGITDVIIVGRGITQSENPIESAREYRSAGWKGYLEKIN